MLGPDLKRRKTDRVRCRALPPPRYHRVVLTAPAVAADWRSGFRAGLVPSDVHWCLSGRSPRASWHTPLDLPAAAGDA